MSERFDDLFEEIFEDVDPEQPGYVTAVYIPENREDLAQTFDIPFEYEAFKKVIGNDFYDVPLIPRKALVFLSKENERDSNERFDLTNELPGNVKGDIIIVMGDDKFVMDMDETMAMFYERKSNAIRYSEGDEEDEDEEQEIKIEEEEEQSEEKNIGADITADTKGGTT